jgi:hypothetical protein
MLQRHAGLRCLPILALVAGLVLLPLLATGAQAAPLRESDPQLRDFGPDGGGLTGWWRAVVGAGEKEGPSIDPNGGGGKSARAGGWWLWKLLVNFVER